MYEEYQVPDSFFDGTGSPSDGAYEQITSLYYGLGKSERSEHLRVTLFSAVESLVSSSAAVSYGEREKNYRFINAMRMSDDFRTIQLKTANDVVALRELIVSSLRKSPQVVEYYARNGEIMELGRILLNCDTGSEEVSSRSVMGFRAGDLYTQEIKIVENLLIAGEDPESFTSLPLDVRAAFSGVLNKEISSREQAYQCSQVVFDIDHVDVFARYGYMMPWARAEQEEAVS